MAKSNSDMAIKLGKWVVHANAAGELVAFRTNDPEQVAHGLDGDIMVELENQRVAPRIWEWHGAGGGYAVGAV